MGQGSDGTSVSCSCTEWRVTLRPPVMTGCGCLPNRYLSARHLGDALNRKTKCLASGSLSAGDVVTITPTHELSFTHKNDESGESK